MQELVCGSLLASEQFAGKHAPTAGPAPPAEQAPTQASVFADAAGVAILDGVDLLAGDAQRGAAVVGATDQVPLGTRQSVAAEAVAAKAVDHPLLKAVFFLVGPDFPLDQRNPDPHRR